MSMIRLMMLSYLFFHFDKVLSRALFLIVFSYLFSAFTVVFHDGMSSMGVCKNPIDLYQRLYSIMKWYYYNQGAVTSGIVIKGLLLAFCVYFIQSSIWRIRWKKIPSLILDRFCGDSSFFSVFRSRSTAPVFPEVIAGWRRAFLSQVGDHVDELLVTLLSYDSSEFTSDNILRVRKMCAIKVGYALEDLIKLVVQNKVDLLDIKQK